MNQLYYRDLRRRVQALEDHHFPEPDPIVTFVGTNHEDGLPDWVSIIGRNFYWQRQPGEPIPPEILQYATPEARAAYETQAAKDPARHTPP